ncbi:type 2 periplasmic-binding domain-containing protein [Imhoffiella purpurea]|uniref:Phosphate ABC transporter substrate-binding protein n=1 Tax=Imhoffiella purpurea TaxID=1249627 RepID=W9W0T4_9GAMM|nr:hypothetical protein [Imhoffiella purpurea]EXJ16220.1 hypothetical protein D779_0525 [Imhoffiella purpurea]
MIASKSNPLVPMLFVGILIAASPSMSEELPLVVVVNASTGIETLTRDQVINIFLGRFRQLPNGEIAIPIDQPAELPIREQFYRRLVNKNPAEIRAYWARLMFSGKTTPPHQADSEQEVLETLMREPGSISYLIENRLQASLKAVFRLEP